MAAALAKPPICRGALRVITLDATGTLLYHREAVAEAYCRCAAKVGARPPAVHDMRAAFKVAFKASLEKWPCFGHAAGITSREWWRRTVHASFEGAGASYGEAEFARVFRRIYQHFGSAEGYMVFGDVPPFLEWASQRYCLGLISNNVDRLADNTLPLLGLHEHLRFYVLSQELGFEKPSSEVFACAREEASAVLGSKVQPEEMLHVGDNYAADYCGARAAGMGAALMSRQGVAQFQTWLHAPDFEGKEREEILQVASFDGVRHLLEDSSVPIGGAGFKRSLKQEEERPATPS